MRKMIKHNKGNDKGISLVELLISLAVGAIVMSALTMLVSQGIKQYNKTTIMTQLQEDADIAMNNISNSIMEANYIDISNSKDDATFQTSQLSSSTDNVIYMVKDKCLYVGSTPADMDKMGLLCKNVDEMKIEVVQSSFKTDISNVGGTARYSITGINNPVQIKITLTLKYQNYERKISRVASVRKKLNANQMRLQGTRFVDLRDLEYVDFTKFIAND